MLEFEYVPLPNVLENGKNTIPHIKLMEVTTFHESLISKFSLKEIIKFISLKFTHELNALMV